MQAALEALAEPRRREILRLVRDEDMTAGVIAARFDDVSRPAISQHLKVLRGAGLVSERRDGTRRWYRARPQGFDELREYLDRYWGDALERLKAEAEDEERRRGRGGTGRRKD
jgi:DNA-binding transcriptional ArsR family regulator